jgi:hypothetical protein
MVHFGYVDVGMLGNYLAICSSFLVITIFVFLFCLQELIKYTC